jgi:hypothetical protein
MALSIDHFHLIFWTRQDSNPQPLDRDLSLLTTRPNLRPYEIEVKHHSICVYTGKPRYSRKMRPANTKIADKKHILTGDFAIRPILLNLKKTEFADKKSGE